MSIRTASHAAGGCEEAADEGRRRRRRRALRGARRGLLHQAFAEGSAFVERAAAILQDPAQAGELARHGLGIAGELARVATLADDPPTRFKGPLGTRKIAAWTDPLPLHEVKSVARALGCTVNDLLLSTAAGALGATCASTARTPTGSRSGRRAGQPARSRGGRSLGNHFGLVFLELPIGIRDPLERLFAVHAAMTQLKGSYQPMLTLGLMAALGTHAGVGRVRGHRPALDQGDLPSRPTSRARSSRCTSRAGASAG